MYFSNTWFWKIYVQKKQSYETPGFEIHVPLAKVLFDWSELNVKNKNRCLIYNRVPRNMNTSKIHGEKEGHHNMVSP